MERADLAIAIRVAGTGKEAYGMMSYASYPARATPVKRRIDTTAATLA